METCIEIKNLSKKFGNKTVVDNLSFNVRKGEVFGLLGHNGAGKSTTIDCILGLKKLDIGSVEVLGQNPRKDRETLFERVGVQLQSSSFQTNIKVGEVCEELASLYKSPTDYLELLKQFKLHEFVKQPVDKLSGGERQKLSVVLALIPNPEIVFLDELTTGLDVSARREVWKLLSALKEKGITIFLTSHYMDEVEALCDRICLLREGRTVAMGTVEELMKNSPYERLEEAYLWYMGEEISE